MAGSDRPSLPPGRHFWLFLLEGRSFLSAGPSFLLIFVGLAVNFSRQAIIFCPFCWLDGCHGRLQPAISCRPGRCFFAQPAETGPSRSLDVATPPFTAPAFGLARNVVEQAPSCRLRRHRSLPGPSRTPVSAHSLRNQRPASPSWPIRSVMTQGARPAKHKG